MNNTVIAEHQRDIVILTLNRPEVFNAIDRATSQHLGTLLDEADQDDSIRCVVITGAGEKAFSAGFDLAFAEQHPEVYDEPLFGSELVRRKPGKPRIAAVNGIAAGLGFELALACDLIIAHTSARFSLPEVKVGLAAMGGGVVRLTRTIGEKQALGMTLTGRQVSATEGFNLGFVTEVCDRDVMATAISWADDIAANGPLSVEATQQMTEDSQLMPMKQALDPTCYASVTKLLASEDATEGRRAFLEKRRPHWRNR